MSNKVNKIKENVEANRKLKSYTLYGSLIGSIIVSIGKLVGKTEEEMIEDFAKFSKDEELAKCKNVLEVCDYVSSLYNLDDNYKQNLVLVYDDNNMYTPVVTLCVDGAVLPLDKNGNYLGVLSKIGEEDIEIEYIYEEEEDEV